MKAKYYLQIVVIMFFVMTASAQKGINYKAIINDSDGNVLASKLVAVQFTILENGTFNVYQELHTLTTDIFGMVIVNIGEGTLISGDFKAIDWVSSTHSLKTEINSGDGYKDMGTEEIKYVPYAHYTETAFLSIMDQVDDADADPTNELQHLSIEDDTIYLSQYGSVVLPNGPAYAVENDLVSYDGTNWIARYALIENRGGGLAQNNMQPFLAVYHVIALTGVFPSRSSSYPFLGEIMRIGFNFPPRGWAMCDGQLLAVSQNTALFSLLGTTFGGDGRTTFGLPDLRGRTAIHPGTGPGLSTRKWGEQGGKELKTMTNNQLPSHTHTITYQ